MAKYLLYALGGLALFLVICIASGPTPPPANLNTVAALAEAGAIIKAHGFDCLYAKEARTNVWKGLNVDCDGLSGREYHYRVEDRGGNWLVQVRY